MVGSQRIDNSASNVYFYALKPGLRIRDNLPGGYGSISKCNEISNNKVELFYQQRSWWMCQEGTTFDHDFYVDVGKQCRTENA